jgi:dCMP deaminase
MATGYQLHKVYIGTAMLMSNISHCVQHKSGAVLVKENRILAQGVNGTPQGMINCDELFDAMKFNADKHEVFSNQWEITAEMNCIMNCARRGIDCKGSEMYSTHIPKMEDLKYFSMIGLKRLYYVHDEDITEEQKKYIFDACTKLGSYIEKFD